MMEMRQEPVPRQRCHLLERSRLLEKMRCAWYDLEANVSAHCVSRTLVQRDDHVIMTPDNE